MYSGGGQYSGGWVLWWVRVLLFGCQFSQGGEVGRAGAAGQAAGRRAEKGLAEGAQARKRAARLWWPLVLLLLSAHPTRAHHLSPHPSTHQPKPNNARPHTCLLPSLSFSSTLSPIPPIHLTPKQERERVGPELERAEDAITEQRREVGKLKRRVDEILDRSFAAFSK